MMLLTIALTEILISNIIYKIALHALIILRALIILPLKLIEKR